MKIRIKKSWLSCCMAVFFGWSIALGAEPTETVDGLKQELKEANTRINQLEEDLFVATAGEGVAEETAEDLPEGVYPWTQYVRRRPMGILFPLTATVPQGRVFGRLSHISQNQLFASSSKGDWFSNWRRKKRRTFGAKCGAVRRRQALSLLPRSDKSPC